MLKGKLLGQYIICEMVTTEKKKMTVRKCRTINRYVNAGHINTPSEARRHKQTALHCESSCEEQKKKQQMTSGGKKT